MFNSEYDFINQIVNNEKYDKMKEDIVLSINNISYNKLEEIHNIVINDNDVDIENSKDIYEIYCDGSFSDQRKVASSGFVVIKNKIVILEHIEVFPELTKDMSNSEDAEFYAFFLVFDWIEKTDFTGSFYIYTDLQSLIRQYENITEDVIIKMFDSNPLYNYIPEKKKKLRYLLKIKESIPNLRKINKKVKVRHVKAHSGIHGNLLVDSLCRSKVKQAYKQKIENLL